MTLPTDAALTAKLTLLEGFSTGFQWEVRHFPVIVGRGEQSDIQIVDDPVNPTISRQHLRLGLAAGRVTVEDLSSNGTSVGDRLLELGERFLLGPQETAAAAQAWQAQKPESAKKLWRQAVELYKDDFLVGCHEDWAIQRRLHLRRFFLSAVSGLGHLLEVDQALPHYQRALNLDPTWEAGHLELLEKLVQADRRHEALFHYQECERVLRRLLDGPPSEALLRFYHQHLT